MDINSIVLAAKQAGASDIHMVRGIPIRFRVDGQLTNYDSHVLTEQDCEAMARALAPERIHEIEDRGELDLAQTFSGQVRCRLNVFRQQESFSCAIRLLSGEIPSLESLSLPPVVESFAAFRRGIVLVTGETGSGKSTTLAALLDRINHTRYEHIITLEDPIEYIYQPDRCTINQREIGTDTQSYATGLRAILREDPDIILIGEMRDQNTIETALTAAETGHLVFATLHTNSATDTIDRIVDVFPGEKQRQIRLQLSMTLQAVLAQQLLPRWAGTGRIPACEVMIPNGAIRNLIREGKAPQMVNALTTSAQDGNFTMDQELIRLVDQHRIKPETALEAAHDTEYVGKALGRKPSRGINGGVTR